MTQQNPTLNPAIASPLRPRQSTIRNPTAAAISNSREPGSATPSNICGSTSDKINSATTNHAATLCAVVARLVVVALPTAPGVALAVLAGALTYAGAIRVLHPLPPQDVDKLRAVVASLPRPLRPAAHAGLHLIWS